MWTQEVQGPCPHGTRHRTSQRRSPVSEGHGTRPRRPGGSRTSLPALRTSAGAPEQPRARARRPRQARFHVVLLGTAICQRAAQRLYWRGPVAAVPH
jgi:hypothetical protein